MKAQRSITLMLGALLVSWLIPQPAEARRQYNPKLKRFMQRDPLCWRPRANAGYQDGLNLYQEAGANPVSKTDPNGTCTCTVQVKASCKSGGKGGLHLYVHFEKHGCGDADESGNAHWGPCGFAGMCPMGSLCDANGENCAPYPRSSGGLWTPGWEDDGTTPNGGAGPQQHDSAPGGTDPCACIKQKMPAHFPVYFFFCVNSNSAAIWAANECGVSTSGIRGYPGQGVPVTPDSYLPAG